MRTYIYVGSQVRLHLLATQTWMFGELSQVVGAVHGPFRPADPTQKAGSGQLWTGVTLRSHSRRIGLDFPSPLLPGAQDLGTQVGGSHGMVAVGPSDERAAEFLAKPFDLGS